MKPKEQGNREERKQAKQLSKWMFNGDEHVLERSATSGAKKTAWSGDIIPIKQLFEFGWKKFNFIIEIKNGYPKDIPTCYNYDRVVNWYLKAKSEGKENNQNIILLICQFKYKKTAMLFTNINFDGRIMFNVCLAAKSDESVNYIFGYYLNDLLELKFEELFDGIDYNY